MSTVLIVDDSESHLVLLQALLREHGLEVLCARSGEEAISIAVEQRPQFVLIDLNMPDVDGWESIKRMRSEDVLGVTPIIAMSASLLDGDECRARVAGCNACVTKPIDMEALLAILNRLARSETNVTTFVS